MLMLIYFCVNAELPNELPEWNSGSTTFSCKKIPVLRSADQIILEKKKPPDFFFSPVVQLTSEENLPAVEKLEGRKLSLVWRLCGLDSGHVIDASIPDFLRWLHEINAWCWLPAFCLYYAERSQSAN